MPKIDKDLQERMEELGMEFVRNPPPPLPNKPQIVSEEVILGPRKLYETVVPQFEKDFEVVIDPSLDTEQFKRNRVKSWGTRLAYLSGNTLRMSQETAEYVDENQALYNLRIIRESK